MQPEHDLTDPTQAFQFSPVTQDLVGVVREALPQNLWVIYAVMLGRVASESWKKGLCDGRMQVTNLPPSGN
jgi:hypothetical protein